MPGLLTQAFQKRAFNDINISFEMPWPIYGMNWSTRTDKTGRIALTSYLEEAQNYVTLLQLCENSEGEFDFDVMHTTEYPFPATKVMWIPDPLGHHQDLLATSGDNLRIWAISEHGVHMASLMNNLTSKEETDVCPPMTSFDWCEIDVGMIVTASVDSSCTVWDIETGQAKMQLIAHDQQVSDTAFAPQSDIFASVGSDGSFRIFDPRTIDHSTIVYESDDKMALSRLAWNKHNTNYVAVTEAYRSKFIVLDIRNATDPLGEYQGHTGSITSVSWSPHSSHHLLTTGTDANCLIWDFSSLPRNLNDADLIYSLPSAVNNGSWCPFQREWVSMVHGSTLHVTAI